MRGALSHTTHLAGQCQDHPHGCGEHKGSSPTKKLDPGSSPRMRGTHHLQDGDPPRTRIIPADAGNTVEDDPRAGFQGDHPRGCGEHVGELEVAVDV